MFHSHSLFEMMRCQVFRALSPMKERQLRSVCVCACRYITEHTGKLLTCIFERESLMMSWFLLWGWMDVVIMYVTSDSILTNYCLESAAQNICSLVVQNSEVKKWLIFNSWMWIWTELAIVYRKINSYCYRIDKKNLLNCYLKKFNRGNNKR